MKLFTLYVSYVKDYVYLQHFSDIIKRLPFFDNANIGFDGWFCKDVEMPSVRDAPIQSLGIPVWKHEYHKTPHGERCYELLEQAETDIVFIVDSDFFCTDERLWKDALNQFANPDVYMVSLSDYPWHGMSNFPSTPFSAYRRKEVLEYIPVKKLWNHFGKVWPELKQPVFDYMKFVYFSLYINGHTYCIDSIAPRQSTKYQFYHLWDSRDTPEENFRRFDKDPGLTTFLMFGLCKFFFRMIREGNRVIPDFIWVYIDRMRSDGYPYCYLVDFFNRFESQIYFNLPWVETFKAIRQQWENRAKA